MDEKKIETIFNELNKYKLKTNDVKDKNGFSYLSWSKAWELLKKQCPTATFEVRKNESGLPYFYDPKVGYMVMTTVTVEGETLECFLPVIDYRNKAILQPTMTDINKALMRCLVKNIALFGLGLYLYEGQDLPSEEDSEDRKAFNNAREDIEKTSFIAGTLINKVKVKALADKCRNDGVDPSYICELCKVSVFEEITEKKYRNIIENWDRIPKA